MQKKMLKKVLLAIGFLVVASTAVVAARPGRYRVERSADPRVSPQVVYALLADASAWPRWSPWSPAEVKMTIIDARLNARVTMRLEFADASHSVATSTIELKPAPNHQTVLLWAVEGTLGFTGKALSLATSREATLGPKLEQGLANLKRELAAR